MNKKGMPIQLRETLRSGYTGKAGSTCDKLGIHAHRALYRGLFKKAQVQGARPPEERGVLWSVR